MKPLEFIHLDLAGPFPLSYGRSRYLIIYIDDYTQIVWGYILKTKTMDKICMVFKSFKAMVDHEKKGLGYQIQRLNSDNRTGEYVNN